MAQAQVQLLTPSNLEKSLGKGQIQVQNVQLQTGNQDYSSLVELIKDLCDTVADLQKMIESQNLRIADYEVREKIRRVWKKAHANYVKVILLK